MSKKKSMNFLVSNLEKIVLVLVLIYVGGIVYLRILRSSKIEYRGQFYSAPELSELLNKEAEEIGKDLQKNTPSGVEVRAYEPKIEGFGKAPILAVQDTVPWMPKYLFGEARPEEERRYTVPEILGLSKAEISITHAQATVPTEARANEDGLMGGAPGGANIMSAAATAVKDVDYVTVTATYPIGQMRTLFQQNFGVGPKVPKPLEHPNPVVAAVELQRSLLKEDGGWGEWEKASRLKNDPIKELPTDNYEIMTGPGFEALLTNRRSADVQMLILQPKPYALIKTTESPSGESLGAGESVGRTTPSIRDAKADRNPAMMDNPGRNDGMMAFGSEKRVSDQFEQMTDVTISAFDEGVRPGEIYRYRMRIGFFNPIAGHGWFTPEQEGLRNQIVLWSEWISPEKVVSIPDRIVFFPVVMNTVGDNSLLVEVYRWESDRWYKNRFRVLPGMMIGHKVPISELREQGRPVRQPASGGTASSLSDVDSPGGVSSSASAGGMASGPTEIDFSTGITIIDILPNGSHWCQQSGRIIKNVESADLIYSDVDKTIKRIGIDRACWPVAWIKQKSQIDRQIREATSRTSAATTGTSGSIRERP